MKNVKLTLITITFFSSLIFPQSKTSSSFVQLKSGEKIFGNIQVVKESLATDFVLINDTLAIAFDKIDNYQTDEGYFVIVDGNVAKRIYKGKLDLYYEANLRFVNGDFDSFPFNNNYMHHEISVRVVDNSVLYFSKNGDSVKEANYRNLANALSDNSKSIKILKEYNNLTYAKYGIGIIGVGLIAYYLADLGNIDSGDIKKPKFGAFAAGGLAIGLSYGIHIFQKPLLKKAVDSYIGLR